MSNKKRNKYVVGMRQVFRELRENNISSITLATDADHNYKTQIINEAKLFGVEVLETATVDSLATEFDIEVPTGVVGYLKNIH